MKNILQKDNQKRDEKIQHKHISHCSLKQNSEKRVGRGWTPEGKKWIYIFKAKEKKQYQNNGTENLFVVIMYLIEAFKMRLLSIAGSFESPKRSNSTFRWLGKFLKNELMLDMSMKKDLRAFSKLRQPRKKCSLSSNCSYIRGSKYLENHV